MADGSASEGEGFRQLQTKRTTSVVIAIAIIKLTPKTNMVMAVFPFVHADNLCTPSSSSSALLHLGAYLSSIIGFTLCLPPPHPPLLRCTAAQLSIAAPQAT